MKKNKEKFTARDLGSIVGFILVIYMAITTFGWYMILIIPWIVIGIIFFILTSTYEDLKNKFKNRKK